MKPRILVDSNVIIYAINRRSTKYSSARAFLRRHERELVVAHQNIIEVLRVLTHATYPHPVKAQKAMAKIKRFLQSFEIVYPKKETVYIALEFVQKYNCSSNALFDAYLAATMISNGITHIATDNERDFAFFKGITVVNPFPRR